MGRGGNYTWKGLTTVAVVMSRHPKSRKRPPELSPHQPEGIISSSRSLLPSTFQAPQQTKRARSVLPSMPAHSLRAASVSLAARRVSEFYFPSVPIHTMARTVHTSSLATAIAL
jgi:hypothetical protein